MRSSVLIGALLTTSFAASSGAQQRPVRNDADALDVKTGKVLWATRLGRRGNADPITYQGRNGKQYVAVVATDTLMAYALN
jgi:glucose dehydrogenase